MLDSPIFYISVSLFSHVISFQGTTKNINLVQNEKENEIEPAVDEWKVQFPNASDYVENTSNLRADQVQFKPDSDEEDDMLTDLFSKEDVTDLRDIVSSIREVSFYDGKYDPFGTHHRRKRSASASTVDVVVTNLNSIATNLEKMVAVRKKEEKKLYFDRAVASLDKYMTAVQKVAKEPQGSNLQIMKVENVLLVQCSGWLWYPVMRLNKTVTCSEGIMRFEGRDRTVARACNLFNCMDLAL